MNGLRRLIVPVVGGAITACASRIGPETFGTAIRPLTPPAVYQVWYDQLARCVGATRPFEGIRWYRVVPSATFADPRTHEVLAGFWTERQDAIILGTRYLDDSAVVKHEMLHYLRHAGNHGDPAFQRGNGCGVAPARDGPPPPVLAGDPQRPEEAPGATAPPVP
jgi:hypothetical protein